MLRGPMLEFDFALDALLCEMRRYRVHRKLTHVVLLAGFVGVSVLLAWAPRKDDLGVQQAAPQERAITMSFVRQPLRRISKHPKPPSTFSQYFESQQFRIPQRPEPFLSIARRFRPFSVAASAGSGDSLGDALDVRWVSMQGEDVEARTGATTMPVFPLGGTYLPFTTQVLSIFEPRYRTMYNDILMSGARRFVVPQGNPTTGDLSEVGAVLYLDELKEVSEQTQDQVKYICQHTVIGRAKLLKVLNPNAAAKRSDKGLETYLRAEVEMLENRDADVNTTDAETVVRQAFNDLVDRQIELEESPRFNVGVKSVAEFRRGNGTNSKGLWGTVEMWQKFLETQASAITRKMTKEIEATVLKYIMENEEAKKKVQSRMSLSDLPEPLAKEVISIQRRHREEYQARLDRDSDFPQLMLQSESHAEQLAIFQEAIKRESMRLAAMASLKAMFKPSAGEKDQA